MYAKHPPIELQEDTDSAAVNIMFLSTLIDHLAAMKASYSTGTSLWTLVIRSDSRHDAAHRSQGTSKRLEQRCQALQHEAEASQKSIEDFVNTRAKKEEQLYTKVCSCCLRDGMSS